MIEIDTDVPTRPDRRRPGRRARTWTWAATAVAGATVAAVLLAPAPIATADSVVPPGIPCASQVQAFYNARQAVINHNSQPHVFTSQEQVNAYNAQGRAIFNIQMQDRQVALDCLRGLAGRSAPALPDPVDHSAPTGQYPTATQAPPAPPAESGDDDWAEKMQEKIYDWYKEQLEKVEKYEEKQQEEKEKQQDEQRQEQERCAQSPQAPPATPSAPSATTPTPAPPICPAAPTTTTTEPGTF